MGTLLFMLQEIIEAEKAGVETFDPLDVDDYLDDPELERLHAERISELKEEAEKRTRQKTLVEQGHGSYQEIDEGEFLEVVTKTKRVVCHFFHQAFERCKIVDKHLESLCRKYIETRFIKLSATVQAVELLRLIKFVLMVLQGGREMLRLWTVDCAPG